MYAHCYRSGEIELSRKSDLDGRICIAKGLKADLEEKLAVRARLAYDGETWLVPGIPEADGDSQAEAALDAFIERMSRPLPKI